MSARPLNALTVGLIFAIAIVGLAIRMININESLWLDELHSSWSISGGFGEIASRAAQGNQPPLYYWLSWLVMNVLGESEFALRLSSVVAGVALIVVAWWLVRKVTESDIAGLASACLIALDPQLIYYATEFRSYGVACLVGVLQVAFFAKLMLGDPVWQPIEKMPEDSGTEKTSDKKRRKKDPQVRIEKQLADPTAHAAALIGWKFRVTFIGLTLLLFYLHYTTILLLFVEVGIAVVALCFANVRSRYKPIWLLLDGAIIALGCLPACLHILSIGGRKEDWSQMVSSWPLQNDILAVLAAYAIAMVSLALIWVFVRGMFADKSRRPFGPWLRMAVFSMSFLLLFAVIWLLTHFRIASLMHLRYLAAGLALPMVAIGLGIGLFKDRRVQLFLAVVVVVAAFAGNYRFNDWFKESVANKRVIPQRFDGWETATQTLARMRNTERLKVFLLPGLVEDYRLPTLDERGEDDERFVRYASFPLKGIYELDPDKFEVIPVHSFPKNGVPFFDEPLLAELKNGGQILLVSRSRQPVGEQYNPASYALNELQIRLAKEKYQLNVPQTQAFGAVHVTMAFASKVPDAE